MLYTIYCNTFAKLNDEDNDLNYREEYHNSEKDFLDIFLRDYRDEM